MAFTKVATVEEIPPGTARQFTVNGRKLALFNVGGAVYAIDDTCTHRGGPLSEGLVAGTKVTCPWHGAVFDVIVDLRPSSPTYRNWESFELLGDEQMSLYIPAGCAHGFQALTEPADVSYRIDRPHDPTEDVTIAFDDPELAISWPLPVAAISPRDREAPSLSSVLQSL